MTGTSVKLPPSLLYPIEIVEVNVSVADEVKRHQSLVRFKYWNKVPDGVPEEGEDVQYVTREFYGIFESPLDGTVSKVCVSAGDKVNDEMTPIFVIEEGCDHSVQYGGLCALCGRDLEVKDYMGYNDTDRAPIAMSHDTAGLTVSLSEAERIESNSTQNLLKNRRLILVVDLDQTVIHASVNAEIGEWIKDPESPHHERVKDVRVFSLREKNINGQEQQSWYYVKIRAHLQRFLEAMAPKYEMHIYTMATRQYALEIAKIIDPDGIYFADRILSRDASGSLLHKDLKRLFPVSTQMVTIIDDRGDVWNWSRNLIRVVPFQFWTSTGDINSQFLPKRSGLITPDQIQTNTANQKEDNELICIEKALTTLYKRFYECYDSQIHSAPSAKRTQNKAGKQQLPDIGKLLPSLKSDVFDGCVILFSGFFPIGTDLDNADVVQWVRSFGAVVLADYLPSVTHVVARDAGTLKARQAAGQNKMVISIEWVFECLEQWKHVDEFKYLFDVPNPIKNISDTNAEETDYKPLNGEQLDNIEWGRDKEIDPRIGNTFLQSIQKGSVDWSDIDEELKELLDEEDDEIDEEDDLEDEENDDNDKPFEEEQDDEREEDDEQEEDDEKDIDDKKDEETKQSENTSGTRHYDDDNDDGSQCINGDTLKRKRDESDVDLGLDEDWD